MDVCIAPWSRAPAKLFDAPGLAHDASALIVNGTRHPAYVVLWVEYHHPQADARAHADLEAVDLEIFDRERPVVVYSLEVVGVFFAVRVLT